ncbi:MAG: TonB-dependent receptor [Asticcacaulis sp.]
MCILPVLLLGAAISCNAYAGPASYPLDIPAQPMHDAMVALALKTNVSIGGVEPTACGVRSRGVHGTYKPEAALAAMLAGSRCDIVRYDATTFRLRLKAPKPAAARLVRPPPPPVRPAPGDTTLVVVSRRPQNLADAPSALTIVNRGVLAGNDLDLSKVAVRVPGMAVTNLGPGRDKILLRGISDSVITGRTQSLVGLYLDDTPLTYNAPDPDLLLTDMTRVEVLKGPQGALYGQGSLAGVVRLVTNKPQAASYESEFSAGVGLTDGGHSSSRLTAMVNVPLIKDKLAVRAVLYNDDFGGFIRDENPDKTATNATGRYGGRLSVRWRIDGNFSLTGSGLLQHLSSKNSQYVYSPAAMYHRSTTLAEPHDNDIEDYALGLEGGTRLGALKVSLNQTRHTIHSGYDAQPLGPIVSVPNSGVLFYDEDQNILLSTQEVSLVSPSERRLRWLAGWFSAQGMEHFTPHLVDVFTEKTLYNEDRVDKTDDAALFGQVSYDFSPRWTASLGLRDAWSHHETASQINHVRLTNYERSGDVAGRIETDRLTHNLLVSYRAGPGLLIYAETSDGFRTGGFNTTTLSVTAIPSRYKGDRLDNYETGLRYQTADNLFRLNLALFHINWRDIQSDQLRSTGLPVTINLGSGVNTGIEAEADWRIAARAACMSPPSSTIRASTGPTLCSPKTRARACPISPGPASAPAPTGINAWAAGCSTTAPPSPTARNRRSTTAPCAWCGWTKSPISTWPLQ